MLNVLCARAQESPQDVPFQSIAGTSLTYERWARSSRTLADALRARCGVRPGERVMVVVDRGKWLEYVIAYVAVLAVGATVVTVRPEEGQTLLLSSARLTGTSFCVFSGVTAREVTSVLDRRFELTDSVIASAGAQAVPSLTAEVKLPELVEILFTSGTTGRRMAVGCPREEFIAGLRQKVSSPVSTSRRRSVLVHHIPLGTQAAQRLLWEALRTSRLTNVHLPDASADAICAAVERLSATFVGLVPFTARRLVREHSADRRLPSVEWVSVGSSPVDTDLLGRLAVLFPNAQVMNMYGLTEGGAARIRGVHPSPRGSLGTPEPGTLVSIRSAGGDPLPCGHQGELWIRRPMVPARFYVGDLAATAAVFHGGWVRTGDVASVDADGYVYLVDRVRDIIDSAGQKVSSVEVENCLRANEMVVDVAVFGAPSALLGERVVAAVVVDRVKSSSSDDVHRALTAHCREQLDPHAVPSRFITLESLPTGPTGKVLKHLLRQRYSQGANWTRQPR